MAAEQAEEVERALWASVRALEESARLAERLAASTQGEIRRRFLEKEHPQVQQADLIRRLLLAGEMLTDRDATRLEEVTDTDQ